MLLISQNLVYYDLEFNEEVVLRFNLAWVDNLEKLEKKISTISNDIFLDIPKGRTKPPNNEYTIDEIRGLVERNKNIKYLAVSNVESSKDIEEYMVSFSDYVNIVPKIETKRGIENFSEIYASLIGEKIVMLDHDDLFSDLIKAGVPASQFMQYINMLSSFCEDSDVSLLKTRGVIFSDKDKYRF